MIKKGLVLIAAALMLVAVIGLAVAVPATVTKGPRNPVVNIPAHAVQLAPGVFSLGTDVVDGKVVEGLLFVHYKEEKAKGGKGGGKGKPGKNDSTTTSTCYTHLAKGAKWKTAEQYLVDATNTEGMSDAFVLAAMDAGVSAWNDEVSGDIFGSLGTGVVDGIDLVSTDGKNEVLFGSIAEPGVIAMSITWGIFGGPPRGRELVEWDAIYDQDDFEWGDATVNPALMDLQNVATHEVGHSAGMGHPADTCLEETMYRFSTQGETKRRSLEAGDIAGIVKLYE